MSDIRTTKPTGHYKAHTVNVPFINVYNDKNIVITQFIYGENIDVFDDGVVQSHTDRYTGLIKGGYGDLTVATHKIIVASSPVFKSSDLKSEHLHTLSLNSSVAILETKGKYSRCAIGWIYTPHLLDINEYSPNTCPAERAMGFLGTPYIWGGRTSAGIDCSALVQMVFASCGIDLPRDADMQEALNNKPVLMNNLQRNDLVFWRGHVGMMIDNNRLLHANATNMYVHIGDLKSICKSINENDGGNITSMQRILKS